MRVRLHYNGERDLGSEAVLTERSETVVGSLGNLDDEFSRTGGAVTVT